MTLSLDEARAAGAIAGGLVAVAVGCHPRHVAGQLAFDRDAFEAIVAGVPAVGEVGLDAQSRVPAERQRRTLREILAVVSRTPRVVSIHSYRATRDVLDELRRALVAAAVLHGWNGSAEETREAVALGCWFSVGAHVVRQAKWRAVVPLDRILLESDQGWADPPAAIPLKVAWIERLLAARLDLDAVTLRYQAWANLARLVRVSGTLQLWPTGISARLEGR